MRAASFVFLGVLLPIGPGAGCGPSAPSARDAAAPADARPRTNDETGPLDREPCQPLAPRLAPPEVWVGPDGLRERLVAFLDGARESLWVGVYELDDPPLLAALGRAAVRGVRVHVLLDGRRDANDRARAELPSQGVRVEAVSDPFPYYHLKVLVRDEAEALVGSANLNTFSMQTERNHMVRTTDPFDVRDLLEVLRSDARGAPPEEADRCTRLLLSPLNARERLMAIVGSARERLDLQQLSLSDEALRALIARRAARGVRVRVILADPGWITGNEEAAAWLRAQGAQVRILRALENHAKLIVVDGALAYVGSHNLSWTAIERNREVGLALTDPNAVAPLQEAFEADWSRASP